MIVGIVVLGIVLVVLAVLVFALLEKKGKRASGPAPKAETGETLLKLRNDLLRSRPERWKIEPYGKHGVFGVLMETGFVEGPATLVALMDGSVSMYFYEGGAVIGAGGRDDIAEIGCQMIAFSDQFVPKCSPAAATPLPKEGEVFFYILTRDGVVAMQTLEHEVECQDHAFHQLFDAAHSVITRIRKASGG
jgi:hypothetical protein